MKSERFSKETTIRDVRTLPLPKGLLKPNKSLQTDQLILTLEPHGKHR